MAVATAVVLGVGQIIGGIAEFNALRSQAAGEKEQGRQQFASAQSQFRRETGQAAVEAGGSGLLTSSFTNVFDAQALENAESLSRIRSATEFNIKNLETAATGALVGGLFKGGSSILGGFATKKAQEQRRKDAERSRPGSRLKPAARAQFFRQGPIGTQLLTRR